MGFMLCTVNWPHSNSLPRDSINWTFAITNKGGNTDLLASSGLATAIDTFQTACNSLLSSQYRYDLGTMEVIELLDPPPRRPVYTWNIVGAPSTSSGYDMPPEVAITISYRGATGSGVNVRRRTGRFFFGPLQQVTMADGPSIPSGSTDLLATEFGKLIIHPDYVFCVYSRYNHHAVPVGRNIGEKNPDDSPVFPEQPEALPSSFTPVETAWVDNAWDTQRRRGTRASTRTVITPS